MTLRTAAVLITEIVALALGAELTTDVDLKTLLDAQEIRVTVPGTRTAADDARAARMEVAIERKLAEVGFIAPQDAPPPPRPGPHGCGHGAEVAPGGWYVVPSATTR